MPPHENYPLEWRDEIPAEVFACLIPGELRIILMPGVGLADGGAPYDIPIDVVPPALRMPNTKLWVSANERWEIVKVWHRDE